MSLSLCSDNFNSSIDLRKRKRIINAASVFYILLPIAKPYRIR